MTISICAEGAPGPFQGRASSNAADLRLLTESESSANLHGTCLVVASLTKIPTTERESGCPSATAAEMLS